LESLLIEKTQNTPEVNFSGNGVLSIIGESTPTLEINFYEPVIKWLDTYLKNPAECTTLTIELSNINVSTSKRLLFLFYKLQELSESGKKVIVNWQYDYLNDKMLEIGEDYAFMLDITFNFIEV